MGWKANNLPHLPCVYYIRFIYIYIYSFNDKHIRWQTNTHCQKEVIKHRFEVRQRISEICESGMEKNIQDPNPKRLFCSSWKKCSYCPINNQKSLFSLRQEFWKGEYLRIERCCSLVTARQSSIKSLSNTRINLALQKLCSFPWYCG